MSQPNNHLTEAEVDRASDAVAVIGIGCRFPGADNPVAFWDLLRSGTDAIGEVPPDRWDVDAYYDPTPATPGKMYTRCGGFLDDVADFDPGFFGISGREAEKMDPQQRLLLEVSWEALEDAAQAVERLADSATGVFVGISNSDYSRLLFRGAGSLNAYSATGTSLSIAANRLSYVFNFRGPSIATDTACSSSLVATHLACQSLRRGESTLAIAGGVNLILTPEGTITFSQARMMAADGRCKTFDAAADGYVRGEGCGMIVLKRLCDAIRDGDRVRAVIRGSAVNQDGLTNGITAPNGPPQQDVIRAALADAGASPEDVEYIEAHGTGTALGDPIEVRSLRAVLAQDDRAGRMLRLGSVKTNIGHLESAAGVAGLIKLILSLQHGQIPPHLHFKQLNPYIDLEGCPIEIPVRPTAWQSKPGERVAGISAFGFGGTNCHMILSDYLPPIEAAVGGGDDRIPDRPAHVLPISARDPEALSDLAGLYAAQIHEQADRSIADFCHAAATGRSHLECRRAIVAETRDSLEQQLLRLAQRDSKDIPVRRRRRIKIAMLFTGQGSQHPFMAQQLYETEPQFREILDRCAEVLAQENVALLEILFPSQAADESRIHQTIYTQPALFVVEYALACLWRRWGIEPQLAAGHSVGEYVAACLAGVFELDDALRLIATRARLMHGMPGDGRMLAVTASGCQVESLIDAVGGRIAIAAYNSPRQTVVSGAAATIEDARVKLQEAGFQVTPLTVSHAFHSPLMDPMLDEFRQVLSKVKLRPPSGIAIVSNLTGKIVGDELATPDYWCQHLRCAVRFTDIFKLLEQKGVHVLLEIGPKPVLCGLGQATLGRSEDRLWVPSLRGGRDPWVTISAAIAELYQRGCAFDWRAFDAGRQFHPLDLPLYPFQRQRYWAPDSMERLGDAADVSIGPMIHGDSASGQAHPLLGRRRDLALDVVVHEARIGATTPRYLADHRLFGEVVFPATGYLEIALAAGRQELASDDVIVEDFDIRQVLHLPTAATVSMQCVLKPGDDGSCVFQILSRPLGESAHVDAVESAASETAANWILHATGSLRRAPAEPLVEASLSCDILDDSAQSLTVAPEMFYDAARDAGLDYGPAFAAIRSLSRSGNTAWAEVSLDAQQQSSARSYRLHPALLDACFQSVGILVPDSLPKDTVLVPVELGRLHVAQGGLSRVTCRVELTEQVAGRHPHLIADVSLFDGEGRLAASAVGLKLMQLSRRDLQNRFHHHIYKWLYQEAWIEKPRLPSEAATSSDGELPLWMIFSDRSELAGQLSTMLEQHHHHAMLVSPASELHLSPDRSTLRPDCPDDFRELIDAIGSFGPKSIQGIAYLWGIDDGETASRTSLQGLLHLTQAIGQSSLDVQQLLVVTDQAQVITGDDCPPAPQGTGAECGTDWASQSALWGLGRVISAELPGLHCRRVDIDASGDLVVEELFEELRWPDRETDVAIRGRQRRVARLIDYASARQQRLQIPGDSYALRLSAFGQLSHLRLEPSGRKAPGENEVEIAVRASGLNFRDVLRALGMLREYEAEIGIRDASDVSFGFECSGVVTRVGSGVTNLKVGDEVIALSTDSMGSHVTVDQCYVSRKPGAMSFDEAASLPLAYLTAYYGLCRLAGLKRGDRVLIHAAAGGVGQAAVAIAHWVGAEVFATASRGKWEFLRSQGIEHIFDSRSLDFADEIIDATGGSGIDVVLNSLNADYIPESLRTLGQGGRFVEIGKIGIWSVEQMTEARSDVTYLPFDLGQQELKQPGLIAGLLAELVPHLNQGRLPALPHKVFAVTDAVDAFRFMQQAMHRGKVIIRMAGPAADRSRVLPDASYLITGGLGALGLEAAQWLIQRGARHVVLTSRGGQPSASAEEKIKALREDGAEVHCRAMDVASREDVLGVLNEISGSMPPLRGIIHAAGVLDDGTIEQQSWSRFEGVMSAKATGTRLLDELTTALDLDFFVGFSSMAATLGSPGQSNYAAANAYLDGSMAWRSRRGLPGLSINWGPWKGAGMAAGADARKWERIGLSMIDPEQGLLLLERLLEDDASRAAVLPIDWRKFLKQFPRNQHPPLLDEIAAAVRQTDASSGTASGAGFASRLADAPPSQRAALVHDLVAQHAAQTLGIRASQLDRDRPLAQMGLDSLMGIELKNAIESDSGVQLSADDFSMETTVADLGRLVAENLTDVDVSQNGSSDVSQPASSPKDDAAITRKLEDVPAEEYDVQSFPEIKELEQRLGSFKALGVDNPYFDVHEGLTRDTTLIGGRRMVNFSSYNYVGSSGAAEVSEAAKKAIDRYGTSVSASRVVSGEKTVHVQLERAIADFVGAEDAIVYVGGHSTNETTIGHLLNPGDLILHDELSHNSIIQGCILSGSQRRGFAHNDWKACEEMLRTMRPQYRRTLIVVEGVYSMDGDYPDLPRFVELRNRYKALLMVDEAHSIGTMGKTGRGILEHFGLQAGDVDLLMGTLSKSFGSCGGYIAGRHALVEYLKYTAPGFVYSVGLSPPNAAAALAAIGRIKNHPEVVQRCQANSRLFLELARELGLNTGTSNATPVVPVIIGNSKLALKLSRRLYDRNINVQPILYPAVEEPAARLRFFISSEHSDEQIRQAVEATAEELATLKQVAAKGVAQG